MNSETGATPQFETVEYTASPGNCFLCNQPIPGTYYRVNGHQACASCVQREQTAQSSSTKNYPRALVFGVTAAVLGMTGYATFEIVTGWIIGYVALAVGWLIGKAMMTGAKGFGGRKYQITAALLTYAAVSLAAIPVMFSQISKQKTERVQVQQQTSAGTSSTQTSSAIADSSKPAVSSDPNLSTDPTFPGDKKPAANAAPTPEKPKMGFGKAVSMLLLIGLASPFLELADPLHGIIGLFILFIGIRIAWTMTARPKLLIDGPF